jgi:hypothetical protein
MSTVREVVALTVSLAVAAAWLRRDKLHHPGIIAGQKWRHVA